MNKYTVIMEKGKYALIDRGETLKEYAVVNGIDKETGEWAWSCEAWNYEYDGKSMGNQASMLASAIDYFRSRTEENFIPRARLEELATLFKDGLIEDDEYEAMIYFNDTCEMEEHEKKFFGIVEDDEDDWL